MDIFRNLLPASARITRDDGGPAIDPAALDAQAAGVDADLARAGAGAGVAVALHLSETTSAAVLALICAHLRRTIPLNPDLPPAEGVALARAGGAGLVLTDDPAMFAALTAQGAACLLVDPAGRPIERAAGSPVHDPTPAMPAAGRDATPGLVLFTSGSTGPQKPMPLNLDQLHAAARGIAGGLALGPRDVALHCLPMFHIGGFVDLMLAPLMAGGHVHHVAARRPVALHAACVAAGATWLQAVPTILLRMLSDLSPAQWADLGARLRFCRVVSSALLPAARDRIEAALGGSVPLLPIYGMTETTGQICATPLADPRRNPASVGPLVAGEMRILRPDGQPCAVDEAGAIQLRGPLVSSGAGPRDAEGWFDTGDLGARDAEGWLVLTGRAKEMINRGGEKIAPLTVEAAALDLPGVADAVAYGMPHPTLGEAVALAVVVGSADAPDGPADWPGFEARLRTHLATRLAPFQRPGSIRRIAAVPRLPSGKLDRRALSAGHPAATPARRPDLPPPADPVEAALRDIWTRVLAAPPAALDEDFFDAGGDSLAASQVILALEAATGRPIDLNLMFDAPRYGTLLARLQDIAAASPATAPAPETPARFAARQIAGWGAPLHPDCPLIAVMRPGAAGTMPVVIGCQDAPEARAIAAAIPDGPPVWALRSLFQRLDKTAAEETALAADYAAALDRLLPPGPLVMGGFCSGAMVLGRTARLLVARGRRVSAFFSIDHWFETPFDIPTRHLFSDSSRHSAHARIARIDGALARQHPAGHGWRHLARPHSAIIDAALPQEVRDDIAALISGRYRFVAGDHAAVAPSALSPSSVRLRLRLTVPRLVAPGAALRADITVENAGAAAIPASADSGLFLRAKFLNLDGHLRAEMPGWIALGPLEPGARCRVAQELRVPDIRLPLRLSVWPILDEVADLTDHGVSPAARLVWPLRPRHRHPDRR